MKMHGGPLDMLDHRILRELQQDARLSMRELGRRVDLSAPAVTERVRRLEETGVIQGYGARVASGPLGRSITAFVGVQDSGKRDPELVRWAQHHDGVLECHSVTGDNSCILKVAVADVRALEGLLGELIQMGFTCDTSIVLSTPLEGKLMLPPGRV
ncbi:Lrp/AsnC family transcriptional regulator [Deinococcus sonorensis]|uniref:Lrp/AsnC family transcriptional regulator n=2 Tax=Deinococcus sonorensis TaxID=309891 RepID=A0AAU7UAG0_9DEIO